MSAIGAITSVGMPLAGYSGVAQPSPNLATPAAQQPASPHRAGEPSGVQGYDFTGDTLADRVIGTFAKDPLGFGSLGSAMDAVSATMTFDPTRGTDQPQPPGATVPIAPGNALSALPPSAAGSMPVGDVIARSESTIAKGYTGMLADLHSGASPQDALAGFAKELGNGLRRDERGMTAYDHADAALEVQKQELIQKLKERVGDPREIVAKLMSLTIAQGMIGREREKVEELMKLIISLILGVQIPKGCVERLQALGLGPMVERIIQDMIGSGKSLSKGMQNSIKSLAGLGINISMLPEEDTEVGIRSAQREREQHAVVASDGRLVDKFGTTVDANAVRGDLADVLRRRAAGVGGVELSRGTLATAGSSGIVTGSPTDGATGIG